MSDKKSGNFLLAGIIGAIAGAVGGLLLAPKSGRETREDIAKRAKEISKNIKTGAGETKERVMTVFGEANKNATAKYEEIKGKVVDKVVALKTAGKEIDKELYANIVEEVVGDYKSDLETTKNGAGKLISLLKKDWDKVKSALS